MTDKTNKPAEIAEDKLDDISGGPHFRNFHGAAFDFQSMWAGGLGVYPQTFDAENGIVDLEPTGNPWWQPVISSSATFTVSFVATTADAGALAAIADGEAALEDYLTDPANANLFFEFGV